MASRNAQPEPASEPLYRDMMTRFLGPVIMRAFDDPDVTEVYTNPQDQRIWTIQRAGRRVDTGERIDSSNVVAFLNTVATTLNTTMGAEAPSLQAELPLGRFRRARLQGLVPPVSPGPCFVIRKHAPNVIPLETYIEDGALTAEDAEVLCHAVSRHWNILVAGGTRSGKTTLAGAILREITRQFPHERVVILEDTVELLCTADDHLALRTPEGGSLADLVKLTLRVSPDRIVVGEVRDHAALYMLDAWQTGHPGSVATLHATSPEGALLRLDLLCQRANVPSQIPLIAEAVQLIVQMELRARAGGTRPTVAQLVHVSGLDAQRRFRLHRVGGVDDDDAPLPPSGNGRVARRSSSPRPPHAPLPPDAGA
jgi:P-type conjugative transfer ATPase TrbB